MTPTHGRIYACLKLLGGGSRGAGAGGKGGNCPPIICLNGMDMPVAPPPAPKFWQSRGISTFLPLQEKNRSRALGGQSEVQKGFSKLEFN